MWPAGRANGQTWETLVAVVRSLQSALAALRLSLEQQVVASVEVEVSDVGISVNAALCGHLAAEGQLHCFPAS